MKKITQNTFLGLIISGLILFCTNGLLAQKTYVPNDNFEKELIRLKYDDVLDDSVLTSKINIIQTLNVSNLLIADLTGIESFTNLNTLVCYSNSLTKLDVSKNTALISLNCSSTKITDLDVSKLSKLLTLKCSYTKIASLDLSKNTVLNTLDCSSIPLTSLDITKNTALKILDCRGTEITTLDVSKSTNLTDFNCQGTPSLACIQVNNISTALKNTKWLISSTAAYSIDCRNGLYAQKIYVPDNNFEQALVDLGLDEINLDDSVRISNIIGLTRLNVSNKNIKSLTGIEYFTNLTYLNCSFNQLTSLDVSKINLSLTSLFCSSNQLTNLDVTKNSFLLELYCNLNKLTSLDLSSSATLTILACESNLLATLDLTKNTILSNIFTKSNPTLKCIQVLDVAKATAKTTWQKDVTAMYSLDCSGITAISADAINSAIQVYPNPSKGIFIFELRAEDELTVLNNLGEEKLSQKMIVGSNTIDFSNQSLGIYFAKFKKSGFVLKIVKD